LPCGNPHPQLKPSDLLFVETPPCFNRYNGGLFGCFVERLVNGEELRGVVWESVDSRFERGATGGHKVDGEVNDLRAREVVLVEQGEVRDGLCSISRDRLI
jgi:hypothetical protein